MTRKEEKQQLRKLIRAMERELPQSYKDQASAAICAHLAAMPEYQAADTVFAFVGTSREIDTTAFLEDVLRRGKRLCVPLCVGDGLMDLHHITSLDQLRTGAYGIREPSPDTPVEDADAVDFVSGHELYNGTGGGAFSPNQPMSRAMLATVLHRLESTPESAPDVLAGFHDGSAVSAWAQEGLSWAVANKVLEGADGNRLAVDSTITREQLATMVYRYAKLCGMDLTVSDAAAVGGQGVSSWAETAMAWAVENGIIEGKDGGTLAPQAAASRAEVAAILQRLVAVMVK